MDVSIVSVEYLVQFKSGSNSISDYLLQGATGNEKTPESSSQSRRQSAKRVSYLEMDDGEEMIDEADSSLVKSRSKKTKKATKEAIKEEETEEESRMVTVIKKGRSAIDSFCPVASTCHVYEEKDCIYGIPFQL